MRGIGLGVEHVHVAGISADVFRRAPPRGIEQPWIRGSGRRRFDPLDLDLVTPVVAEVVGIIELLGAGAFDEVDQPGFARVEQAATVVSIGCAPAQPAKPELMEMAVGPAHRGLDGQMQPIEADVERHLDPAGDARLDIGKRDLEARDGAHPASLGPAHTRRQCPSPGKQLIDAVDGIAGGEGFESGGQIGERIGELVPWRWTPKPSTV